MPESALQLVDFHTALSAVIGVAMVAQTWLLRSHLYKCVARYRRITVREVAGSAAILGACVAGLYVLFAYCGELMHWGWTRAVFGQTHNVMMSPAIWAIHDSGVSLVAPVAATLFVGVLLLVMPLIVEMEENVFRRSVTRAWPFLHRNFAFGLAHMIVGVPFAAALVLVGAGMVYHICYLHRRLRLQQQGVDSATADEEAIEHAIRLHLGANTILLSLAVVMVWFFWGSRFL